MTLKAATDFREIVNQDPALAETLRGLLDGNGLLNLPEAVKLGAQHGFEYSEADIQALFSNDNDELSDFELEMVSAGLPINCSSGMNEMPGA